MYISSVKYLKNIPYFSYLTCWNYLYDASTVIFVPFPLQDSIGFGERHDFETYFETSFLSISPVPLSLAWGLKMLAWKVLISYGRSTTIWIFVTLSLCNINNVLYELKCCRAELWSNVAWIEAWRSSRASLVFSIKRKGPLHSRKISTDRTFPENIIVKSRKFSTSEFSFFRPKICVSQSHLITFCGKFSWVEMGLYRSANSAQEMLI
jgi:hypothetical protein